jgi:hypothetical protein
MGTEAVTPSELLADARSAYTPAPLWTPRQTAQRLVVSVGTLAGWRGCEKMRVRLPFIIVGGLIRYRPEAVEAFLQAQTADGVNVPSQRKPGPGRPKSSAKKKRAKK